MPTQTFEIPQKLFTYRDAAEFLGCAEITLRKAVSEGRLSCTKIGRRSVRFTPDQIASFIHERPARYPEGAAS